MPFGIPYIYRRNDGRVGSLGVHSLSNIGRSIYCTLGGGREILRLNRRKPSLSWEGTLKEVTLQGMERKKSPEFESKFLLSAADIIVAEISAKSALL